MSIDLNLHSDTAPPYSQSMRKYESKPLAWLRSRNWVWKRKTRSNPWEDVIAESPSVRDLEIPNSSINSGLIHTNLSSMENLSACSTSSNRPEMKHGITDFGLPVDSVEFSVPSPDPRIFDDPDSKTFKHCQSYNLASSNKVTARGSIAKVLLTSISSIESNQAEIGDSDADQITNAIETEKKDGAEAPVKKRGFLKPFWHKIQSIRAKSLLNEDDEVPGDMTSELFVLYDDEAEANFNILVTSIRSVLDGNMEHYKGPKETKLIRSDRSTSNSKKRGSVSTGFNEEATLV